MNAEENSEIQAEIEVLEVLRKACLTMRGNRKRPVLAGPASRWEITVNKRLEELYRTKTPELPLKSVKMAAVV